MAVQAESIELNREYPGIAGTPEQIVQTRSWSRGYSSAEKITRNADAIDAVRPYAVSRRENLTNILESVGLGLVVLGVGGIGLSFFQNNQIIREIYTLAGTSIASLGFLNILVGLGIENYELQKKMGARESSEPGRRLPVLNPAH